MLEPMGITTEVWDESERVTGIMSTFRIGVNAQPGESREIEMWRLQMHNLIADAARWSCVREGCVRTRASSGMAVLSGGQGNIGVAECDVRQRQAFLAWTFGPSHPANRQDVRFQTEKKMWWMSRIRRRLRSG